jgi:NH3-dependent NAD+ synthetase
MPALRPAALVSFLVSEIARFHKENGLPRASLDVSGGIDSAVMAGLLVLALGSENVVFDHSILKTNPEQTARAQALCDAVGAKLAIVDLTDEYNMLVGKIKASMIAAEVSSEEEIEYRITKDRTILGSIRSTLRAPVGRAFNRLFGGGVRHGTGNECEDRWIRFYQKGGDGEVDTNPISSLSKGEVYQVAVELAAIFSALNGAAAAEAFKVIINATPSPDLWGEGDAHSDESELFNQFGYHLTYSRVNPVTGAYAYTGTIEQISRLLDACPALEHDLFFTDVDVFTLVSKYSEDLMAYPALDQGAGFGKMLAVVRRAERITRHKLNPAIPTIVTRKQLLARGLITNTL